MKGKQKKHKKGLFGIKIEKNIQKVEETVKKDVNIIKEDIKRLETPENVNFFVTYGWAILVILIGISGFVWWQYFSVHSETCNFVEGSNLLCEKFDVTNEALNIEIRNMNNKTITVNRVKLHSCIINPEQNIPDNDRRTFSIPCNISSGKFKEKVVVTYKVEDFEKNVIAKLSKIVP